MLLLCLGTGVGVTRIAAASVRTGFAMTRGLAWGAVGRATARVAPTSVRGFTQRAGQSPAPTEGTVVRWDGGRPQGSPLRGRTPPVKIPRRVCRLRQNYARGRLGAFWRKNRRFFARDDKRAVPEWDSPFESVKRVYCAALAALMDSISSGTTLNRSPTIP